MISRGTKKNLPLVPFSNAYKSQIWAYVHVRAWDAIHLPDIDGRYTIESQPEMIPSACIKNRLVSGLEPRLQPEYNSQQYRRPHW